MSADAERKSSIPVHALNVLRGGLIGAAEIVPGVSGGTVALVVGIFEDLISAAGHVVTATKLAISGDRSTAARVLRMAKWSVVVPALIGMAVALVVGAKILEPVIADHPVESRAIFAGLILASLAVPYRMVGRWRPRDVFFAVLAAISTVFLTGIPPANNANPNLFFVAVIAAIAICALVLPGVSGSFILLSFGIYEATLGALNDRDFAYIGVFALGATIGLALFVKGLEHLLEHHHRITLAIMTGLMAGSLRALWPWQDADRNLLAPEQNWPQITGLVLLGIAIVTALIWVASKREPIKDDATPLAP